MKKYNLIIISLGIITLLNSCSVGMGSYTPKITLESAPAPVNATLMVDNFDNKTPPSNLVFSLTGYSVLHKKVLDTPIEKSLKNEIMKDFTINSVFTKVVDDCEDPDLVLHCEIINFLGLYKQKTYSLIPLVNWGIAFGAPMINCNVELEFVFTILKRNSITKF